jgi:hypothetical protein
MFQASLETCSGDASRKPLMSPPLEKCSPCARSTITRTAGFSSSDSNNQPQLVALGHGDDVVGRAVQHDVCALALGVDLDAEAIQLLEQGLGRVGQLGHGRALVDQWKKGIQGLGMRARAAG